MYGYIYITTNTVNGKRYIGKHKATEFTTRYKGSGKILKQAFEKYGIDKFVVEFIEECDSLEQLNQREQYWIEKYDAQNSNDFYNIRWGGDGGDIALYMSKDDMNKIRKDHSEYIKTRLDQDEEFHKNFAGAKRGHKCYQTTKDKIGSAQREYWSRTPYEVKHERLSRSAKTRCTGRIWITNELVDKFIKPEDFLKYKVLGFKFGRKFQKRNKPCKKRATINENTTEKKDLR